MACQAHASQLRMNSGEQVLHSALSDGSDFQDPTTPAAETRTEARGNALPKTCSSMIRGCVTISRPPKCTDLEMPESLCTQACWVFWSVPSRMNISWPRLLVLAPPIGPSPKAKTRSGSLTLDEKAMLRSRNDKLPGGFSPCSILKRPFG